MDIKKPMKETADSGNVPPEGNASFPRAMRIAGFLWLLLGGLIIVGAAAILFRLVILGEGLQGIATLGGFGLIILLALAMILLVGVLFVFMGVWTVRGSLKDPAKQAHRSIALGILAVLPATRNPEVMAVVIFCCIAAPFLAAGVLALISRKAYLAWRAGQSQI